MRGILRGYEFSAFESQSAQVNSFEQRFSPAEQDWIGSIQLRKM